MNINDAPANKPNDGLPKISIVTPSYNQGDYIEETIQSILSQNYPNLEYIVMDGGSRDKSVEIIKKYADKIDYWVSEKDRGQSHAINKGLARCTGEIFNWINSDDMLMPGALWAVAEAWKRNPGSIIAGNTERFDDKRILSTVKAEGQTLKNFVRFWEAEGFGWTQQGTFLPITAIRGVDGVKEDLTYCMDYYLMVKILAAGANVTYVDQTLSRFRHHALSKTVGAKKDFRLERVTALRSISDLPIPVQGWEWDAEQARRLVDMARHAWGCRSYWHASGLIWQALTSSPKGTFGEINRRLNGKVRGQQEA